MPDFIPFILGGKDRLYLFFFLIDNVDSIIGYYQFCLLGRDYYSIDYLKRSVDMLKETIELNGFAVGHVAGLGYKVDKVKA